MDSARPDLIRRDSRGHDGTELPRPAEDADSATVLVTRQLAGAVSVVRVAQVGMATMATVVHAHEYVSLNLVVALLAGTAAWTGLWVLVLVRSGGHSRGWVYADVAIVLVLHFLLADQLFGVAATSWPDWSNLITLGTCLTLGATQRVEVAFSLAALLSLGYYTATQTGADVSTVATANQIGNSLSFVAFTAIAFVIARLLGNGARALDAARAETLVAERSRARLAATQAERSRQYRLLHDTVLATLSAISRGGWTEDRDLIRSRCARDAAILRNLLVAEEVTIRAAGDADTGDATALLDAVRAVVDEHTAQGLQVHLMPDLDEVAVDDEVVRALSEAVREALNNVARHAGTGEAWVRVRTRPEGVTVTVVDRGAGFDADQVTLGWGLRHSVDTRLAEVDASHRIDSEPGEGTIVELRWTP